MLPIVWSRPDRRQVRKAFYLAGLGLIFCTLAGAAQLTPSADSVCIPRRVVAFDHVSKELVIKCDAGYLIIKAYAEGIIQVRYSATRPRTPAIPRGIQPSPADLQYRVESTNTSLKLATAKLAVTVDRKTAKMTFLDPKGHVLLVSKQYRLRESWMPDSSAPSIHAEFQSPESEAFYGLTESPEDGTDLRGQSVHITHDTPFGEVEEAGPLLVTNRGYGFVFCNSSDTTVVLGENGVTTWDADSGDSLVYFVICGVTTEEIVQGYRYLTGRTPR